MQHIPENTVLSHDLLEGVFARAALASDIEVVEEFPSRYDVEVARQHRWMRGDWQLLPWIFGSATTRCPLLGRWKMLDNIRRSLSAPAMLLAFLIGWQLPIPAALVWTAFLALVIFLPPLLPILSAVLPRQRGFPCAAMRATWRTTFAGVHADPVQRHVHGAARLPGAGCHPAHHVPVVREPQESAGMGHIRAVGL